MNGRGKDVVKVLLRRVEGLEWSAGGVGKGLVRCHGSAETEGTIQDAQTNPFFNAVAPWNPLHTAGPPILVPHLLANLSVDRLSAKASMAGLIMQIMVVLQLPPRLSSRILVSLESL
jgi:hypothetical protein